MELQYRDCSRTLTSRIECILTENAELLCKQPGLMQNCVSILIALVNNEIHERTNGCKETE